MNSYLGPVMKKYVNNFRSSIEGLGIKVEPYVTQSNGSIISIKELSLIHICASRSTAPFMALMNPLLL